jgi:RNA-directed DNA polymerase
MDKVYTRKNVEMAWERVKADRGSGGVDGQTPEVFAEPLDRNLNRLERELKEGLYQPQPVRQVQIPKMGKSGEFRGLGIPTDASCATPTTRMSMFAVIARASG